MCHSSTSPLRYSYSKGLNVNRGSSLSSVTSACPANSRAVKSPPTPPPMITTFAFEFILLPSSGEMSETLKWYQSRSDNAQHSVGAKLNLSHDQALILTQRAQRYSQRNAKTVFPSDLCERLCDLCV